MVDSTAAAHAAETTLDTTLDKLREQTDAVVQRLRPQIDAVSTYARDEPTKALLIAAATGAALMGLVALMSRSGGRVQALQDDARDSGQSILATIREAALDLANRAQSTATDALGTAQKYVETQQGRAQDTADSAASRVSDTVGKAWQSLRDQAAEGVDKVRPRIDAAASYAKEDPARVALGVAAAGAVLVGLMSLIRHSERD